MSGWVRMPFGKHEGEMIKDIPTDYLVWVVRNCKRISWILDRAIKDQLLERGVRWDESRRSYGDRQDQYRHADPSPGGSTRQVITRSQMQDMMAKWFRKLSMRWHPDRGGTLEAMQAVNNARDDLEALLKELALL